MMEFFLLMSTLMILAVLLTPKISSFSARARQAEAKTALTQIYQLEQAYFLKNNTYAGFGSAEAMLGQGAHCSASNPIGFTLPRCNSHYGYYVEANGKTFTAHAVSGAGTHNKIVSGCATADMWKINQENVLENSSNATVLCQ